MSNSRLRHTLFAAAALAALSAAPAFADDCNARYASPWEPGNGTSYTIEAISDGPTCEQAIAVYTVRGADGALLYSEVYSANQIMVLVGQATKTDMKGALFQWTMQDTYEGNIANTATLPEWKSGAEAPDGGEFTFYPETGVDQAYYKQLRTAKVPMICYVQGMESMACLALYEGGFVMVGVQVFPG